MSMEAKYALIWAEEAVEDLEEIRAYLAQHIEEAAQRITKEIYAAIRRYLPNRPRMFAAYEDIPGLRRMVRERYSVFYHISEAQKAVVVVRIRHHAMNMAIDRRAKDDSRF